MARALALVAQEKRKDGRWEYGARLHESVQSRSEQNAMSQCGYILDRNPTRADEVLAVTITANAAAVAAGGG